MASSAFFQARASSFDSGRRCSLDQDAKRSHPRNLRITACLALLALLLAGGLPAKAAEEPQAMVEKLGQEVMEIIKTTSPGIGERQGRFRALFKQYFDARAISRFVLAQGWKQLSEEQRERYKDLFYNYIAAMYAIEFGHYKGATFRTRNSTAVGVDDTTVNAEIDQPGRATLHLAFRVRKTPDGLKVVDVATESASLLVTMRDQVVQVLAREGTDGVLKRLRGLIMPLNNPTLR